MTSSVNQVLGIVDAAMRLQEVRAHVAARNIALANTPGAQTGRLDVTEQFSRLRAAMNDPSALARELEALQISSPEDMVTYSDVAQSAGAMSLDAEVSELSAASGRYQSLAEGLTRQFALMQLAMGNIK